MIDKDQIRRWLYDREPPWPDHVVHEVAQMLASPNPATRAHGLELFDEIVAQCLRASCLNYRNLIDGYREPIAAIMHGVIDAWASRAANHASSSHESSRPGAGRPA